MSRNIHEKRTELKTDRHVSCKYTYLVFDGQFSMQYIGVMISPCLVLASLLILLAGIVLLMYPYYADQAATTDSRSISGGLYAVTVFLDESYK